METSGVDINGSGLAIVEVDVIRLALITAALVVAANGLGMTAEPAQAPADAPKTLLSALIGATTSDERLALYDRIRESETPVLIHALEAYKAGLLGIQDGEPAIYGSRNDLGAGRRVYPVLDALTGRPVVSPAGKPAFVDAPSATRKAPRAERKIIGRLVSRLMLFHPDARQRTDAITQAGERAEKDVLDLLHGQLAANPHDSCSYELRVAIARIELAHGDRPAKLAAARMLCELTPLGAADALNEVRQVAGEEGDRELVVAINEALAAIGCHQRRISLIQNTFSGASLASILILMALGLSIIFGLMRVINMAHGEFMMIGAFTAFGVSECFKRFLPSSLFDLYWLLAMPMAFVAAAAVGWLCEVIIVRRLYGRQLDSLLATFGISLVLIQVVRLIFGDTTALTPPSWFEGGWEVGRGLVLPWNRLFIIAYCGVCVGLTYLVLYRSKFGLLLRATTLDRETAASLGINTRRIDSLAFALGTGLAGLAGCAVILFDKLNPQMGQGYIVDSFLVVVLGGVDKLFGVIAAGSGLGFINKYIEPWLQAVYGKIAVLMLVVVVLRWRPRGLFADKGRLADE